MIINAGIARVVVRNSPTDFIALYVQDWVENDGSLSGEAGY